MTSTGGPDKADGALEVHVLGEFAVLRAGKDVGLPPSRKTRALLAGLGRPTSSAAPRASVRDVLGHAGRSARSVALEPFEDQAGRERRGTRGARHRPQHGGATKPIDCARPAAHHGDAGPAFARRIRARARRAFVQGRLPRRPVAATLSRVRSLADDPHINDVDLIKARILRTLVWRLAAEPSRALPYAHALQAMQPGDAALAAAVGALAERAREQADRRRSRSTAAMRPPRRPPT